MDKLEQIPENSMVTVTDMGHIKEIQYLQKYNPVATIKKLDKETYMVIATGEVKEFEHIENRSQSTNSLRQTFKKLRYRINSNFYGNRNELFLTLTYAENMTDLKKLKKDYDYFMKKLRRRFPNEKIEYINVVEPQARGAWHCHVLLRFDDRQVAYLSNSGKKSDMASLWPHGFSRVKSLDGIDNVGAYLTAYLADIELTEENVQECLINSGKLGEFEVKEVEKDGKHKKFIKGGRLYLYPPGMNIYRCSTGIVDPPRQRLPFTIAQKKVGHTKPHYEKVTHINTDDFENTIITQQYNLKRTF